MCYAISILKLEQIPLIKTANYENMFIEFRVKKSASNKSGHILATLLAIKDHSSITSAKRWVGGVKK